MSAGPWDTLPRAPRHGSHLLCSQLTRPLWWRPRPQGSLGSRDSYCVSVALPSCAITHATLASTGELRLRAKERPRPRGCTVGTPPGMRRGPGLLSPAGGRAHRHPKGGNPDPAPPGLPRAGVVAEVGGWGALQGTGGPATGFGPGSAAGLRPCVGREDGCPPACPGRLLRTSPADKLTCSQQPQLLLTLHL